MLEGALLGDLLGEVFAGVEEFEEAADGFDAVVEELNCAGLSKCARRSAQRVSQGYGLRFGCAEVVYSVVRERGACCSKERTLLKQRLMRREDAGCLGPDDEAHDGTGKVAGKRRSRGYNVLVGKGQLGIVASDIALGIASLASLAHVDVSRWVGDGLVRPDAALGLRHDVVWIGRGEKAVCIQLEWKE